MLNRKYLIAGLALVGLILIVSACQSTPTRSAVTPPPAGTSAAPTEVLPTPTATIPPARTLTVCLGQEPQTLYAYGGSSRAMWSVLEAVYDGPFDTRQFAAQPVILEKMPSLNDGDIKLQPVTVKAGDEVVDASGNLTTLAKGTKVLPTTCTSSDCAVEYDGASEIQVDQMTVTFKLKAGIQWSDGQPLTAADSVFSYQIAASEDTPVSKRMTDRTADYKALDERTVQWTGKPGFVYSRAFTNFWLPLPEHQLKGKSPKDLVAAPEVAQTPLGWGPYVIKQWVKGDHISLTKNPAYFRASEGLPKFDNLVYRFIGDAGSNGLAAVQNGECDVLDQSTLLNSQVEKVLELQKSGKLTAAIGQGPEWEHIELGVRPAANDNLQDPNAKPRPAIFADQRVRQAFAYCMDRQGVVNKQLAGQSVVPAGFLPPSSPLLVKDLAQYPYDTNKGSALLDESGWKDDDNNPSTPRHAVGVQGVPDGTALEVSYATTQAALRVAAAQQLADSMKPCGIALNVQPVSPDALYAPGPDGPLFGRQFDMAEFAWQADNQSSCYLYTTSQIPTAANHWVGANISGYSNPEFDAACSAALGLLPEQPGYVEKNQAVQTLYAAQLPSIPLFFQLKIQAGRPDLCGLDTDVTARSGLWNIESLDYGAGCKK